MEAWSTNENMISNEYDLNIYNSSMFLLVQTKILESPSDFIAGSDPQTPEFTALFILDDRFKVQYKIKQNK